MSVLLNLILEEERRLKALLPIYRGKMVGCVDEIQLTEYKTMYELAKRDLQEIKPFADLAREKSADKK